MAGMLKLVTVLFADIVGSTGQAARMHPEDVHELLTGYFAAMREEIEAEGGVVEKFVGDAILAVFGVPRAHDDDPVRAVRAARRMLARLEQLDEELSPPEKLRIRIGVNTGDVIAAPSVGLDQIVTGDPVNVASRLEEQAEPGTVVVGERTARAASPCFELREREPLTVEGHAGPVRVWEVLRPRATGTGVRAPMIAREPELAFLQAVLQRVQAERAAHLVTIVGDPGVGKTRVVSEFVATLETRARLLFGRCADRGEGVTLRPFAEILRAEAVVLEDDPPDTVRAKVEQLAEEPEMAEVLESMLGLESGEETASPRAGSQRLLDAWRRLLSRMAATEPLVVVLEDLHSADETTLDILDGLAESVVGPVCFICTSRPELARLRRGWGAGKRNFSSLTLGPLDADASSRLLAALLDSEQLPAEAAQRVLGAAEGNPFFLEEIVRRLVDAGLLEHADGRCRVVGDLSSISLPETVEGVILARIDLLSPSERRTLQHAAVVGRVFWQGAVERATGTSAEADLAALCRRELVQEQLSSTLVGEAEFGFKHGLTRDVAYSSLPRRDRAEAHRRVAEWLAETAGDDELLAHHHEAAYDLTGEDALRTAARREYLVGSYRALRRFAIAQAVSLGCRAVELSREGERTEALEQFGDLWAAAHSGDEAWEAYRSALELAGDRETRVRLAAKAAVQATRWNGAMHDPPSTAELEQLLDEGLEAAGDGDSRLRALLLMSRGFEEVMGYSIGRRRSEEAAREALAIAERLDDPDLVSGALDAVGAQLLARGAYGEHLRFGRRRVELVPRLTDHAEVGDAHVMAAWSAIYVGRYEEAAGHATACIDSARGIDPGNYVHGLAWRVWARTMLGDWDGALADQAELERIQDQTTDVPLAFTLRGYSAATFVHEHRGETEAASRYLALLERLACECAASIEHDAALAAGARAYAHRGEPEAGARLLSLQSRFFAPPTHEALCELARLGENWADAGRIGAAARAQAQVSEALALPLFADRLDGCAAAARGESEQAAAALRRSAEGFAQLSAPWEEAISLLLLGEALGSDTDIERARALFERLGAAPALAPSR